MLAQEDMMARTYEDRLIRVLDHIHAHPGDELSLDVLADVAAFSRFHFHRVFRAVTGETVAATVKRIRMDHAAVALAYSDRPIAEIARDVGYADTASFSRAFAAQQGLPPAAYRKFGQYRPHLATIQSGGHDMTHPVTIKEMPARRLAAIEKYGPYNETGQAMDKLCATLGARGLMDKVGEAVCIYYDSPEEKAPAELRMHAGFELAKGEIAPPLDEITLPAGRYAVMRHTGPFSGLEAAYREFYGAWLPGSGEEPGDAPAFETYPGMREDTPPDKLVTEMWMLLT
jgi:AraC family transcriptional regulator